MAVEQWRAVPGFDGYYEVSDHGHVRSLDRTITHQGGKRKVRGRTLTPKVNTAGRYQVGLNKNGDCTVVQVHRLVMLTFVGPCPSGMEVCHNDGDCRNNRVSNLRYDTRSANQYDRVRHGNHHNAAKTHCLRGHPLSGVNLRLDSSGRRICKTCKRINDPKGRNYHGRARSV